MGGGAGGSHPGRSRRCRQHAGGDRGDQAAARGHELHALVNNAGDLAEGRRAAAARLDRDHARRLAARVPGQFLRADHAGARAGRRAQGGQGLGGQRHLDRRLARASVRGRGLCHLEGGARLAHARDGAPTSAGSASASTPSRRARSTPRSCRPAPRRSSSKSRCTGSARPTRWRRSSTCCARRQSSYVNGAEIHINGGQHVLSRSADARDRPYCFRDGPRDRAYSCRSRWRPVLHDAF